MSLSHLRELVETLEFEEYGWLRLEGAEVMPDSLRLRLEVAPEGNVVQEWAVTCAQPLRYRILSERVDDLKVTDDHVLVWEHTEPTRGLFFLGKPEDAVRLSWALYEKHRAVTKGWVPFERYLRSHWLGPGTLFGGGHGLLAVGPERLIREYMTVLSDHGLEPYFGPGVSNAYNTGIEAAAGDSGLTALILGDSFVVGTQFNAVHIGTRHVTDEVEAA